jgi:hypothetical protein
MPDLRRPDVQVTVRITAETNDDLMRLRKRTGVSIAKTARDALTHWLKMKRLEETTTHDTII